MLESNQSVTLFSQVENKRIGTQICDVTVISNLLLVPTMNLEAHFLGS